LDFSDVGELLLKIEKLLSEVGEIYEKVFGERLPRDISGLDSDFFEDIRPDRERAPRT